jgi:hypothetical protein
MWAARVFTAAGSAYAAARSKTLFVPLGRSIVFIPIVARPAGQGTRLKPCPDTATMLAPSMKTRRVMGSGGLVRGSAEWRKTKVGKISKKQIEEIARPKWRTWTSSTWKPSCAVWPAPPAEWASTSSGFLLGIRFSSQSCCGG